MTQETGILFYGWAAYLSAAAAILTFFTGRLFFWTGKGFGKLNDLFSIFQFILTIPLIFLFNQLMTPPRVITIILSSAMGLGGIIFSAAGQIRLLVGQIDFEGSQKYFPAGGAIGFWLMMANLSAAGSPELPGGLIWTGLGAGLGYLLVAGGFLKGGHSAPIFISGSILLGILYPTWAIWLGNLLIASLS